MTEVVKFLSESGAADRLEKVLATSLRKDCEGYASAVMHVYAELPRGQFYADLGTAVRALRA